MGGQPAGHGFPYAVERKDRTVYFSSLRNGERENFFGAVVSSEPLVETLHGVASGRLAVWDPAARGSPARRDVRGTPRTGHIERRQPWARSIFTTRVRG